jgi:hypothetical protein
MLKPRTEPRVYIILEMVMEKDNFFTAEILIIRIVTFPHHTNVACHSVIGLYVFRIVNGDSS